MTEDANLFPDLRGAPMSREAAAECSPGRKPGVKIHSGFRAPQGRQTLMIVIDRPLRGLGSFSKPDPPGLTPGATLCRRFAAR